MQKAFTWTKKYAFWILLSIGLAIFTYTRWPHTIEKQDILVYNPPREELIPLPFYADSTTIVHFYAHWCGPCMKELPELIEYKKMLQERGCRLVLITDDKPIFVENFILRFQIPIYATASLKSLNVFSIPLTYFYDRQGKITSREEGMCPWNENFIASKIKEMNHE